MFKFHIGVTAISLASIAGVTLGAIALLTSDNAPNFQTYTTAHITDSGVHSQSCLVWWATDGIEASGRILACDKD